jgi:hypothetical protein
VSPAKRGETFVPYPPRKWEVKTHNITNPGNITAILSKARGNKTRFEYGQQEDKIHPLSTEKPRVKNTRACQFITTSGETLRNMVGGGGFEPPASTV